MEITKTNLALVGKCKCGGNVAATMIYGGVSIEPEITDTLAKLYNKGGSISIVDAIDNPVSITDCSCNEANAKLIAEAGTVYNEVGKSPRQLADENEELLEKCRMAFNLCDKLQFPTESELLELKNSLYETIKKHTAQP